MIFNMTGGGSGSGATLVVSCPANVTVTVSKDDKSYTKNSGNLGSATFKGLDTGEWTVTIEGNEQTATKNITITADYAITMAFFAAYINITYPANSTCTVKTSGGVTVASDSNATSSAKTWTATVNSTGTYTITATATDESGKSKSTTVSIIAAGQAESVTLAYQLILYNYGDLCSSVTGGWGTVGNQPGSIKFNSDHIYWSYGSGSNVDSAVVTNNLIDFSGYTKLRFEVAYSNITYWCRCGYSPNQLYDNLTAYVQLSGSNTSKITKDVSLDNVGKVYPKVFFGAEVTYLKVYKIWLE